MSPGVKATALTSIVSIGFVGAVTAIILNLPEREEVKEQAEQKLAENFYTEPQSNILKTPQSNTERALLAEALINAGSPHDYPHWRSIAPATTAWQQRKSSADLFRNSGQCDVPIHFSVFEPQAWTQVFGWMHELNEAYQSANLALCFSRDRRLPDTKCELEQNRVRCDVPTDTYPDRLHVVVGEEGLANTRNGQVHIALTSEADVLVHELGHALGFADEYPMRYELAMQFCSGQFRFEPLNLKITQSDLITQQQYDELKQRLPWAEFIEQPIATKTELGGSAYWRLGSADRSEPGLFPAATCDGTPFQAWKPVAERTFMEQHETGSIPELYLKLLQQSLSR